MSAQAGKAIGVVVVVAGAGVAVWWFLKRSALVGAPVGGGVPVAPEPSTPQPTGGAGGGPNVGAIIGAGISTAGTIAGAIAAAGGGVAAAGGVAAGGVVAASGAAAVTAVPAAGAVSAGVGGSTVAGSVAASQAGTAAAGSTTAAGSATAGGSSGLGAFFTNPWTIGIGAALVVAGFIIRARRNETKDDREDFCESLGFYDVTGFAFGKELKIGSMDKLHAAMLAADPTVGEALWIEATQQIGKHDKARNIAWCHKVLQLFGLENAPAVLQGLPYDAPYDDELPDLSEDPLLEMMA